MNDARVALKSFDNHHYSPGRPRWFIGAWMVASRALLETRLPWPYPLKRAVLRVFGARVGAAVVIKQRVRIKYPWLLSVGDDAWIGEGVWIDSLAQVSIGANACLSQGVMVETGNHDWSATSFDLIVRSVNIQDGAWAAVRSLLLPGSLLASHAVLAAGAVLSGSTEEYGIYAGNPARKVKQRRIGETPVTSAQSATGERALVAPLRANGAEEPHITEGHGGLP